MNSNCFEKKGNHFTNDEELHVQPDKVQKKVENLPNYCLIVLI